MDGTRVKARHCAPAKFPFTAFLFSTHNRQESELHDSPHSAYVRRIAVILVIGQHLETAYIFLEVFEPFRAGTRFGGECCNILPL